MIVCDDINQPRGKVRASSAVGNDRSSLGLIAVISYLPNNSCMRHVCHWENDLCYLSCHNSGVHSPQNNLRSILQLSKHRCGKRKLQGCSVQVTHVDFPRVTFWIMWGFVSPLAQKITPAIQAFYLGDLRGLPSEMTAAWWVIWLEMFRVNVARYKAGR